MDNEIRCLAWRQMHRRRHCPSMKVLAQGGPHVERHLAYCPDCRTALELASEAAKLEGALLNLPLEMPAPSSPVPGDVRALRPGTDPASRVDEDGTFYNPPLLLVLSEPNNHGNYRVAQVFNKAALQDEGDISLGRGLIAEAWNVYDVPAHALASVPYAHVGRQYAEAVLKASKGPFSDIEEGSALFSFRIDECRVGSFFSLPLILEGLRKEEEAKLSKVPVLTLYPEKALDARNVGGAQALRKERLAAMLEQSWPSDCLPLAAADRESPNSNPSQRMVVSIDQGNGEQEPWPAELRIKSLNGETHCAIDCRLPASSSVDVFSMSSNDSELMQARGTLEKDILHIDAFFDGEVSAKDLHVAIILLSDPQEA